MLPVRSWSGVSGRAGDVSNWCALWCDERRAFSDGRSRRARDFARIRRRHGGRWWRRCRRRRGLLLGFDRQCFEQDAGTGGRGAGKERPARQLFSVHEYPLRLIAPLAALRAEERSCDVRDQRRWLTTELGGGTIAPARFVARGITLGAHPARCPFVSYGVSDGAPPEASRSPCPADPDASSNRCTRRCRRPADR